VSQLDQLRMYMISAYMNRRKEIKRRTGKIIPWEPF